MASSLTLKELRNMQEADLIREIAQQYRTIARLAHAVKSGAEKGSHLLTKANTQLARMLTVLSELRARQEAPTISAPPHNQPQ